MVPVSLIELVEQALPADMSIADLTCFGKPEWRKHKQHMFLAYALRKSHRLNWTAYLENYPDVKASGVDPILHFLRNGVFEKRKLFSWHPDHKKSMGMHPKVSIIITNHNKGIFLQNCLDSVFAQTLNEIEVIVVDTGSTDESLDIIRNTAAKHKNMKILALPENLGLHLARKNGVAAVSGDYVMFLNSEDYLETNACECAWKQIAKGYDICEFKINPVTSRDLTEKRCKDFLSLYDWLPRGEYNGFDLIDLAYKDRKLSVQLICKIAVAGLVRQAFIEMEDGNYPYNADYYEFLIIAHKARNLLKISDTIYNKTVPPTGRFYPDYISPYPDKPRMLTLMEPIRRYCEDHALQTIYKHVQEYIFQDSLGALPDLDEKCANAWFTNLAIMFEPLYTAEYLLKYKFLKWEDVSSKFIYFKKPDKHKRIKRIGIYYLKVSPGGVETTIRNLIRLLRERGIEVVLFLQQRTEYDMLVAPHVPVYYVTFSQHNIQIDMQHVRDLHQAVVLSEVDIVLYMFILYPITLWDVILLKLMGVSVIGSARLDFNYELLTRGRKYPHSAMLQTLRCMDKVFCLSTSTQIYLRAQEIDAEYIPNTIRKCGTPIPASKHGDVIVVIARMHEKLKKVKHCLLVLREVLQERPNARMVFVGGWDVPDAKTKFYDYIKMLGLEGHVRVTDWTDDPFPHIDQAKLLFSASFLEGFPNGISEAQSRGLPVVMYYLDIMMAKDNESIIQVEQDDYKAAARVICSLLRDDAERIRLGKIALINAAKFSEEHFFNNIINLVETFANRSSMVYYSAKDYLTAIDGLAFYAGKSLPPL